MSQLPSLIELTRQVESQIANARLRIALAEDDVDAARSRLKGAKADWRAAQGARQLLEIMAQQERQAEAAAASAAAVAAKKAAAEARGDEAVPSPAGPAAPAEGV